MEPAIKRDSSEFDARLGRCPVELRELVGFLRTAAEHASLAVEQPTYEVRGVGVTYWVNGRRFCRFDPKEVAGHLWVFIPGGNRDALEKVGKLSEREDGPWLTLTDLHGAVRVIPEILAACDRASEKPPAR